MANNHNAATVEPYLPEVLVAAHADVLQKAGFVWEPSGLSSDHPLGQQVYVYAEDGPNDLDEDDCEVLWPETFQRICRDGGIPEIVIMGAYWCDKLRPGEFGGYIIRITRDSFQIGGTQQQLSQFREEIPT